MIIERRGGTWKQPHEVRAERRLSSSGASWAEVNRPRSITGISAVGKEISIGPRSPAASVQI